MRFKDTCVLVGAKFKVRRARTIVTILTMSVLYGVVIGAMMILSGYFGNLNAYNAKNYGDQIITFGTVDFLNDYNQLISDKAQALYEASDDEDKVNPVQVIEYDDGFIQNILDESSDFVREARRLASESFMEQSLRSLQQVVTNYGGEIVGRTEDYSARGTLTIENLTGGDGLTGVAFGADVKVVPTSLLEHIVQIKTHRDDAIQVLMPLDLAAQYFQIPAPGPRAKDPVGQLTRYINSVNEQAIGHEFTSQLTDSEGNVREITYQIVGLWPSRQVSTISADTIDPLQSMLSGFFSNVAMQSSYAFYVINPESAAFRESYEESFRTAMSKQYLVAFSDVQDIIRLQRDRADDHSLRAGVYGSLFDNRETIQRNRDSLDSALVFFIVFFTVVSIIIMAGTLSRITDDERSSIALYRAVGATTREILHIYIGYMLILSLLSIFAAMLIGLLLSLGATLLETGLLTANASTLYNLPDLAPMVLLGFDWRIVLVWLAIIATSLISLLLVVKKLVAKDIIKDLKR